MILKFPPRKPYDPGVRVGWPAITLRRSVVRPTPRMELFRAGLDRIDRQAARERLWILVAAFFEAMVIFGFLGAFLVGAVLYAAS